jgi:SAM-dependent methyltransferase
MAEIQGGSAAANPSGSDRPDDAQGSWARLAPDYERARREEDSLDKLLEWPAERSLIGRVAGATVLDMGCGNGEKAAELLQLGAASVVGIDIAANFIEPIPRGLHLVQGDLSDLDRQPAITDRVFDRILFLQSLGYARDQVHTLATARKHLSSDGFMVVARSHPIRFAIERSEKNGTTMGEEYYSTEPYSYASGWNEQITLTHPGGTVADMINTFAEAGLRIETAVEPQMNEEDRHRYPHKQAWLNKHLGIIIFKLRSTHDGDH